MNSINATGLRKNLYAMLNGVVQHNDIVNVTTSSGTAVIMSEEDYNGLMETVYLNSVPNLANDILKAKEEPLNECTIFDMEEEW